MSVPITKRLISVEEYHKMGEVGILSSQDRMELINGEIIQRMTPIGSPHASGVKRLNKLFSKLLEEKATIGIQDPVTLNNFSEPEPDISILKYKDDFYEEKHPVTEDVYFLIEVSHSTLGYDKESKLPLYASTGIKECWIVDVENRKLEVHKNPKKGTYSLVETFLSSDTVELSEWSIKIPVADLLGKMKTV